MKRCTEFIIRDVTSILDYSFDVDRKTYCARVEGHTGSHSFIHNGKRVKQVG